MTRTCKQCNTSFEITDQDLLFYDKVSPVFGGKKYQIPPPTLCPTCRDRRRLSFRNERKMYVRRSDFSGKDIFAIYSPDKPNKVYDVNEWWSDSYDPVQYGRRFDFHKPFFEQFARLIQDVPQMNLIGSNNENCPYCNLLANCKRCYLIIESSNNEDCYYGYWLQQCLGCVDTSFSHESKYCYEADNCYNCYNIKWSKDCTNCYDSFFLDNCIGCKNCFGCVNQTQKEFCVFNEQYTKEKYEEFVASFHSFKYSEIQKWYTKFLDFSKTQPKKYIHMLSSENCTGDYIMNSKDCESCFHAHDAENCKYGEHVWRTSRYNMDVSTVGRDAELIYEAINTGIDSYNNQFCVQLWTCSDMQYCYGCFNSKNNFGCVGLKRQQYCILNKQYMEEEYEELVPKIIEHMITTGEYGEFFSSAISPFGYNETVAQEYFPFQKEDAIKLGFKWTDYVSPKPDVKKIIPASKLPDDSSQIPDDILNWALTCEITNKPYIITKQELKFYRDHKIPIPRRHPDQRHQERMEWRNPRKLWERKCSTCGKDVQSSYSSDRTEKVLCEECYLKEVY
jgi:hypothetical protein